MKKIYLEIVQSFRQKALISALFCLFFDILPKLLIRPSAVVRDDGFKADFYSAGFKGKSKFAFITNIKRKFDFDTVNPFLLFLTVVVLSGKIMRTEQLRF